MPLHVHVRSYNDGPMASPSAQNLRSHGVHDRVRVVVLPENELGRSIGRPAVTSTFTKNDNPESGRWSGLIEGFEFEDGGTTFVSALEKRESPFGSLWINFDATETPFSPKNLKRFLQLKNTLERLSISALENSLVSLPFFAKANALDYQIYATDILAMDMAGRWT